MWRSRRIDTPTEGLRRPGAVAARRRVQLRLTQRQLAEIVGLSQSTISRFERGLAPGLRLERYATIVIALGLLNRDEAKRRAS